MISPEPNSLLMRHDEGRAVPVGTAAGGTATASIHLSTDTNLSQDLNHHPGLDGKQLRKEVSAFRMMDD